MTIPNVRDVWVHSLRRWLVICAVVSVAASCSCSERTITSDDAQPHRLDASGKPDAASITGLQSAWVTTISSCKSVTTSQLILHQNDLYLAGALSRLYFPKADTWFGTKKTVAAGAEEIFVVKAGTDGKVKGVSRASCTQYIGVHSLALDASGNTYVVGPFSGTAQFGSQQLTAIAGSYIAKIKPDGTFAWAKMIPDFNSKAIAVSPKGEVFIAGGIHAFIGSWDFYVAKLASDGTVAWWAIGGTQYADFAEALAIDKDGNAYVTGWAGSPVTPASSEVQFGTTKSSFTRGEGDIFVAKVSPAGAFKWGVTAGGPFDDQGSSLTISSKGSLVLTGNFGGGFKIRPPSAAHFGGEKLATRGSKDIFVAELTTDGKFVWATSGGSTCMDTEGSVTVGPNGRVFVSGELGDGCSSGSFGRLPFKQQAKTAGLLAEIDSGKVLWVASAPRNGDLVVDASPNLYLAGNFFRVTDFLVQMKAAKSCTFDSGASNPEFDGFLWKAEPPSVK
jgi:Beta-propeller repeat